MVRLEELVVDPGSTALIVIDVQNDFCASEPGCSYFERQENDEGHENDLRPIQKTVHSHLIPFLERAREAGLYVVFVQSEYTPKQFAESGPMSELCVRGTKGWQFYEVVPDPKNDKEIVTAKSDYSAYNNNGLQEFLQSNEIDTVLIAGFTTDNCVKATTYDSARHTYRTVVLPDCVSTAGYKIDSHHKPTLSEFETRAYLSAVESAKVSFESK